MTADDCRSAFETPHIAYSRRNFSTAASPNKVLSREQLLDRVWGYDYFGDGRLVDVHIRRLRTKVEADPAVPQHILTVRGMGYKLVP